MDIDKLIHAVNTVIIPPRTNKIIKCQTSLVLFGNKMNVVTEPLKKGDLPLPRGLHLQSSHTTYNCGSQRIHVSLYNTKDQPVILKKCTPVGCMVVVNIIPKKVLLPGTLEALDRQEEDDISQLTIEERREKLFEKLYLSGLDSWMPENKEKALDLLAEFNNVFALEDGEMGCTEVTEHHIEVTDPRPFKEWPQNIPEGLLQEVKDHLDHMLDVGAIKPSNSVWSNTVIFHQKERWRAEVLY